MPTFDTKYFLLVKDVCANTEYIFSDKILTEKTLVSAFSNCFRQLKSTKENLQMINHEMYCECFETVNFLNTGWFYNCTSTKTQVCYIIRAIEVGFLDYTDITKSSKIPVKEPLFVDDCLSEMVSELKYRLSQPNFGLKS